MGLAIIPRTRRLTALIKSTLADPRRHGVPLVRVPPCYWVVDRFSPDSVIVDIGLGFDADFSQAMLKRFPVQSYGFDPTRKHAPALASIAAASSGRFKFVPAAVSTESGTLQFHESANNVSGSLLAAHPNVRGQQHETYSVSAMTLDEILDQVPAERIALAKLDVEGIEYDVLKSVSDATLLRVPQWVIEFHHGVVQPFRFADTRRHVRRFERLGYRTYSRDGINFLWFKG